MYEISYSSSKRLVLFLVMSKIKSEIVLCPISVKKHLKYRQTSPVEMRYWTLCPLLRVVFKELAVSPNGYKRWWLRLVGKLPKSPRHQWLGYQTYYQRVWYNFGKNNFWLKKKGGCFKWAAFKTPVDWWIFLSLVTGWLFRFFYHKNWGKLLYPIWLCHIFQMGWFNQHLVMSRASGDFLQLCFKLLSGCLVQLDVIYTLKKNRHEIITQTIRLHNWDSM